MSLISSFIKNQFVKAIEDEFSAHSADLQTAFIGQVDAFANELASWVKSKVEPTAPKPE